MTGWDHTRNLHIKRPIVLIFLPSLLEIQIVYESTSISTDKTGCNEI